MRARKADGVSSSIAQCPFCSQFGHSANLSGTPLCDSCVSATATSGSDDFHLFDYPHIATYVPTPSNTMSSSGDFPDINKSITTKFMYFPVKFKIVHVAALLDSGSYISVVSLSLNNMLPVSVKQIS